MKCLTTQEANDYLNEVGLRVDDWNRIIDVEQHNHHDRRLHCINYRAPKEALLSFCHHAAGWLPKGNWKIFQIDNSTGWLDPVQLSLFSGLLFGGEKIRDLNSLESRTFLFEFGKGREDDENTELLLANLMYVFLLFESHGYLVSSGSSTGQRLGIQDGFVYFLSRDPNLSSAEGLLEKFERNPLSAPQWVFDIIAKRQTRDLVKKESNRT